MVGLESQSSIDLYGLQTWKLDWQEVFFNGTDPLPQPKLVPGKGWEQKNARKFSQ